MLPDDTTPSLSLPHLEFAIYLTYALSLVCFCLVLIGGTYALFRTMRLPASDERGQNVDPGDILIERFQTPEGHVTDKFSFSRFAGALGAIGFSAVFIAFGFWALCGLFLVPQMLPRFDAISGYLFAAAVFFFPYAANQIGLRWHKTPEA